MQPDGVFLSNGPGDPEPCDYAIRAIQELLAAEGGECMVVALPDPVKGERLVVLHVGKTASDALLSSARATEMPPLWIPSRAILLGELPRLGSGKLDYVAAKNRALEE